MLEILDKILGSKIFSLSTLGLVLVLVIVLGVLGFQNSSLEKKSEELKKTLDTQSQLVVDLKSQIQMKDLEIHYLQKGMNIATEFDSSAQQALENESAVKQDLLQTVMSNEETQDWWNTPIPDDVLNLITCH